MIAPKATRIINRPRTDTEYEYEVGKFFGFSGLNEDEHFEHVGYYTNREEALAKANEVDGIILHRPYINGSRKMTEERKEVIAK